MPALLERTETPEIIVPPGVMPMEVFQGPVESVNHRARTTLLEGATGSGKSTIAPEYMLNAIRAEGGTGLVLVTQPRRLAAEGGSNQLEKRMGKGKVGYRHGGGSNVTDETEIIFTVDDSLVNEIQRDALLENYDAIIIDEAHELTPGMVLNFGLLHDIQAKREAMGKPLKIEITTATMDRELYENFFENSEYLKVPGRTFPVDVHFIDDEDFLDDPEMKTRILQGARIIDGDLAPSDIPRVIGRLMAYSMLTESGDKAAILSGSADIDEAMREYQRFGELLAAERGVTFTAEAVKIMGGPSDGSVMKKIRHEEDDKPIAIFGSPVIEASITIPELVEIYDAGETNINENNEVTGISSLVTTKHSQDSSTQRDGRAGRVRRGTSRKLFTRKALANRAKRLDSALMRSDPSSFVLKLKLLGYEDIESFKFIEHPGKQRIDFALRTLYRLDAIDEEGKIKPEGKEMAELPMDPHHARMLVEAKKHGVTDAVLTVVGLMNSTKQLLARPQRGETMASKYPEFVYPGSDFLTMLNVWNAYTDQVKKHKGNPTVVTNWAVTHGINEAALKDARYYKEEHAKDGILREEQISKEYDKIDIAAQSEGIQTSIIKGLADTLVEREGPTTFKFADDRKKGIHLGGSVIEPGYFVTGKIITTGTVPKQYWASMNQNVSPKVYRELVERMKHTPSANVLDENAGQAAVAEVERASRERQTQARTATTVVDNTVLPEGQRTPILDAFTRAFEPEDHASIHVEQVPRSHHDQDPRPLEQVRAEVAAHQVRDVHVSMEHEESEGDTQEHDFVQRRRGGFNGPEGFWRKTRRAAGRVVRFWRWFNWQRNQ